MQSNMFEILRERGVDEKKIEKIRADLNSMSEKFFSNKNLARTSHATRGFSARDEVKEQIIRSPRHLELFMDLYKYDYEIYGFIPPMKMSN